MKPTLFVMAVVAVAAMSRSLWSGPTGEQMLPGNRAQSDAHADSLAASPSQGLGPDAKQEQPLAWLRPSDVPAAGG